MSPLDVRGINCCLLLLSNIIHGQSTDPGKEYRASWTGRGSGQSVVFGIHDELRKCVANSPAF